MPRSTTPPPPPIRIVPVDDSAFAREGIRAILKLDRGIQVVGEAGSRARAIEEVHRTKPDVVIMDMRLPDGTGSDACRDILSAFPRMRILFFSAYSDDSDLYDAVMAGGHGYLTKDTGAKDLLRAIKTIAAGRSLLGPKETTHILSWMKDTAMNTPAVLPPTLLPIDLKLLSMLAEGATIRPSPLPSRKSRAPSPHFCRHSIRNYASVGGPKQCTISSRSSTHFTTPTM